jgi:hypothetical protein
MKHHLRNCGHAVLAVLFILALMADADRRDAKSDEIVVTHMTSR